MTTISIRTVSTLTEQEEQRLFGWGDDIFGVNGYGIEWRAKTWNILLAADGQPLSNVAILQHTIVVGGQRIRVGGIGDVVTLPHAQGQGYARRLLHQAVTFICHELQAPFALLFSIERLRPFYARQGWHHVAAPVMIEQPAGTRLSPISVMVRPCGDAPWPPGSIDIQGLPW